MRTIIALLAAAALAGCVGKPSQHAIETSRTYQQPRTAVWQGLLAHLESRHWPLNVVDTADGTIYAEPRPIGQHTGYADCGDRAGMGSDPQESVRLNIFVKAISADTTSVEVNLKFTELLTGFYTRDCTSLGVMEAQILDALR